MRFTSNLFIIAAIAIAPSMWSATAHAGCTNKAAKATSFTESQAKWFAMETIVQQVDWGIWPVWVASGKTPGYTFRKIRYNCGPGSLGTDLATECTARAQVCSAN